MKQTIIILLALVLFAACTTTKPKQSRIPYCMMGKDIYHYVDSNGVYNPDKFRP